MKMLTSLKVPIYFFFYIHLLRNKMLYIVLNIEIVSYSCSILFSKLISSGQGFHSLSTECYVHIKLR